VKGRKTCFSRDELARWRRNHLDEERRRIEAERRRLLG